jgi:hypothetical protein
MEKKGKWEDGLFKYENDVVSEALWREYRDRVNTLSDGGFYNYIEEPDEKDMEIMINYLKNDYENGFEREFKLRKSPYRNKFKVSFDMTPEGNILTVMDIKTAEVFKQMKEGLSKQMKEYAENIKEKVGFDRFSKKEKEKWGYGSRIKRG